ncbi:ribonuclease Z [Parabacteroides sp. FAFU027]|uniref:ribonuclease Z n=1 Tax=Parabacteroides sp. FAFU027 TaxID=2922715 RepID=UPI001FAEE62E|nr:ribonuclease Z [Parabacteroides sp. FAFU027]
MEKFDLNILGTGSALPTTRFNPTSQVVNFRDNLFMIDCGEGAQTQLRKMQLKFSRLSHIFLSHLHGDHCFGLMGLISTLGLLDRTGELVVHAHPDAEKVFRPLLDYFCAELPYKVIFNPIAPQKHELILEERSLRVYSIPLKHRVPTCGFLFEEKPRPRHIIREMTDFYQVPVRDMNRLKDGADFVREDGTVIPNDNLTRPAEPTRKYAYCSDTTYHKSIVPIIEGVDLLFHEATFLEKEKARAKQTMHSTALQAAKIAQAAQVKKLVIGHFSARYNDLNVLLEEAKTIFPETVLAEEAKCYPI